MAVRGTWRLAQGLGLKALVHGGQAGALGIDQREHKSLFDLQLTKQWLGHWRIEARWRRNATEEEAFSERFPWKPAILFGRDNREITSIRVGWENEKDRIRFAWRRLALARVRQNVGWESGLVTPAATDRTTAFIPRVAGTFGDVGGTPTYRIDLPSTGDYDIRAALGDTNGSLHAHDWDFKDSSTLLMSVTDTTNNGFDDASGVFINENYWGVQNNLVTKLLFSDILHVLYRS